MAPIDAEFIKGIIGERFLITALGAVNFTQKKSNGTYH
jgi:hypothetical protein